MKREGEKKGRGGKKRGGEKKSATGKKKVRCLRAAGGRAWVAARCCALGPLLGTNGEEGNPSAPTASGRGKKTITAPFGFQVWRTNSTAACRGERSWA